MLRSGWLLGGRTPLRGCVRATLARQLKSSKGRRSVCGRAVLEAPNANVWGDLFAHHTKHDCKQGIGRLLRLYQATLLDTRLESFHSMCPVFCG